MASDNSGRRSAAYFSICSVKARFKGGNETADGGYVIPGKLKEITDDFSKKLQNLLGEKLFGVYLTGSAALGGYRFSKSDIDLTVVLRQRMP